MSLLQPNEDDTQLWTRSCQHRLKIRTYWLAVVGSAAARVVAKHLPVDPEMCTVGPLVQPNEDDTQLWTRSCQHRLKIRTYWLAVVFPGN
jgi:hypothetical protein